MSCNDNIRGSLVCCVAAHDCGIVLDLVELDSDAVALQVLIVLLVGEASIRER